MSTRAARTDATTTAPRKGKRMSDRQVVGFLGRKIFEAMNDEDGDLSKTREDLFNRYYGAQYGSERDGYSKITTREVLETVEWCMPSLMRIFTGSDRVVEFDATGAEDEQAAQQETDVVNHKVMKANGGDGFIALHDFIKDALMFPTSYGKAWVEEEEKKTTHTVEGVPATGLATIMEREGTEILEQDSRTIGVAVDVPNPQDPTQTITQIQQLEVFDLKYRTTNKRKVLRIAGVPGEEALVDSTLTSINIDKGDFVAHRVQKTFSSLVHEGFDPDDLEGVGDEDYQYNDERTNRLFYEDENPDAANEEDASMRKFWVHECYCWLDYDGTGVAQYRKIVLIGATIFENEETDYQPMVAMSSILVPHKHNGLAVAQLVEDLQELQTTLTRQLLDNIYRINVRRKIFSEDSLLEDGSTIEAMLNVQAEWIPVRGPAANAIFPEQTQSILGDILPVIQHTQQMTSMRSGIAPENNMDADVLQQTTAGAFMGAMEKAGERVELVARIMAETGIKQLFRKVHQLCRMYPDIAATVKLRGKWVDVDPQGWEDRTDMTVNVGLGFNSKQTMVGLLTQMLQMQKEAMPTGLADIKNLYATLQKLVEASGVGAVEQFFNDPNSPTFKEPEPQPDPQAILAQAQAQALGQEQERKMYETQSKIPLEQQKMQGDAMKAQSEAQLKHAELEQKAREQRLREREADLKERELEVRTQEVYAGIRNKDADTELKEAQVLKTVASVGTDAKKALEPKPDTQQPKTDEGPQNDD